MFQYPSVFSGGIVYPDGPPAHVVAQQSFSVIMRCQGYSKPSLKGRPDKSLAVKITGPGESAVTAFSLLSPPSPSSLSLTYTSLPLSPQSLSPLLPFLSPTLLSLPLTYPSVPSSHLPSLPLILPSLSHHPFSFSHIPFLSLLFPPFLSSPLPPCL